MIDNPDRIIMEGLEDMKGDESNLTDTLIRSDTKKMAKKSGGIFYRLINRSLLQLTIKKSKEENINQLAVNEERIDNLLITRQDIRVYWWRYIILILFASYSLSNAFQWIQYSIITNIVIQFYNESLPTSTLAQNNVVNLTSLIYMVLYIPLAIPATYMLDKYGLRPMALIATFLNATGAIIKVASAHPNLFWLSMVGQTVSASAQAFILGVPARLAAIWFSSNELATATSVGVFGNQLGVAIGFAIPPLIAVAKGDALQSNLFQLYMIVAIICTSLFILVFIAMETKPQSPPSKAESNAPDVKHEWKHYLNRIKNLGRNKNFVLLAISYGLSTGAYYAIGTLLNPILNTYFPSEEIAIGHCGLILITSGLLGAIICGFVLDKTRKYKIVTVIIYFLCLVSLVGFCATPYLKNIYYMYYISFFLGFFMTGYLPVGFDLAAEITYPESEAISSAILNIASQIFGIIFTIIHTQMLQELGPLYGNIFLICAIVLGLVLTILIKEDLRRTHITLMRNNDEVAVAN